MKRWVSLCFVLLAFAGQAQGKGGMVGNGGDAVLQEFNLRGIQVANFLMAEPLIAQAYKIDPIRFLEIVKMTRLEGQEQLFLGGTEVDAINYPWDLRIEVSRSRWRQSAERADAYFVQRRIALHEYLWVYGINDDMYSVSNPIIMEIEKSAGPILDPDVQKLLLDQFCGRVDLLDFDGAGELLRWGLDLNEECRTPGSEGGYSPMEHLLFSYLREPVSSPVNSNRLELIRKMLLFGANPNQAGFILGNPILIDAMGNDLEFLRLLFDFGADPNLLNDKGESVFSVAASISGYIQMSKEAFWMFFDSGGDVNLLGASRSPAQRIVSKENNIDVVEALIQTGRVDWCKSLDPALRVRTIDLVRSEYQPLLQKHQISCGRFATLFGRGKTCAQAQDDGLKQCMDLKFKYGAFDPGAVQEGCLQQLGEAGNALTYMALFHCSDYQLR